MRVLVTGAAGFIGFHLSRRLLADGHAVDGYDGMTPYYDVRLKQARWAELSRASAFRGEVGMLEDTGALSSFGEAGKPDLIVEFGGIYLHEFVRPAQGWRSRRLLEEICWQRGL